ncbi:MAG: glycosyltransferase family 4 protein [Candidatus Edwardsbacteria bacterium]
MRVAYIVEHCHKRGGHERYVAELAQRVALSNNEVHIFSNSFSEVANPKVIWHRVAMFHRPTVVMWLSFIINSTRQILRQKFDIIHSQGPNAILQNVVTNHTTQRARIKKLAGVEDVENRSILRHCHDFLFLKMVCWLEGVIYNPRRKTKIIAVSEGVKRETVKYYGKSPDEIAVIPNGVDLERFHPGNKTLYRRDIRKQWGIGEKEIVLLFVGGDWERKGLECLIRAIPLLKNEPVRLLVVGKWHRQPYYEKIVLGLHLKDKVIFSGASKRVEELYAASDIYILPSLYEACSLSVLEAAATGLPIITTKINGTEEMIVEGKNGYFISRDSEEIAEKVRWLCKSQGLRMQLGEEARHTAEDYSWDKTSQRVLTLYEEIAPKA